MTYTVTVSRESGYWVAVVEGMRGGATETRRLSALDTEVRDLISGLTDIDPQEILLEWDLWPALHDATKVVESLHDLRRDLDAAQRHYDESLRATVHALNDEQVSLRDTAYLVGLSHQRVHQLLSD